MSDFMNTVEQGVQDVSQSGGQQGSQQGNQQGSGDQQQQGGNQQGGGGNFQQDDKYINEAVDTIASKEGVPGAADATMNKDVDNVANKYL
ncbi:MAG: hypothetical protein M1838_000790 [Thelocarpon superellum]|nr:MAG: hypothetical protein M1838_000790 [Thelocarpon superellum]